MSSGAVKRKTPTFGLNIINYDFPRWHTFDWQNWDTLDAVLKAANLTAVKGIWQNNTSYLVGDRVVDDASSSIWICSVAHTSAASGTFEADRIANPTYWASVTTLPVDRGNWVTAVVYNTFDIVKQNNAWYICIISHTSGVFATDLAAGKWALIFSVQPAIDAQTAAETAQTAAELAETNAETAATNSANSASAAATSAGNAATSATNASNSASAASTSASNALASKNAAATSETNAAGSASAASTSATNASNSAAAAAASYDSFDDRYLGAKAADPTVDNDGNPLIVGALYFNNVANVMKVYDGALWNATIGGGGMFQGEFGTTGTRDGDIFRVVQQQLNTDVTIAGTHNAHTPGPLTVASGVTLTIASGGNLVIT